MGKSVRFIVRYDSEQDVNQYQDFSYEVRLAGLRRGINLVSYVTVITYEAKLSGKIISGYNF
jgi:hypothetical protein